MIPPKMWRELVLPCHRSIVEELDIPVIWHTDGAIESLLPMAIESLLPMAIEAGFRGVHGLEPAAGIDLGRVKRTFGDNLVLVGNVDVAVLCSSNVSAVRSEVARCIEQGAHGGGYMLSSCNSIFKGMHPPSIVEMYRYAGKVGASAARLDDEN